MGCRTRGRVQKIGGEGRQERGVHPGRGRSVERGTISGRGGSAQGERDRFCRGERSVKFWTDFLPWFLSKSGKLPKSDSFQNQDRRWKKLHKRFAGKEDIA